MPFWSLRFMDPRSPVLYILGSSRLWYILMGHVSTSATMQHVPYSASTPFGYCTVLYTQLSGCAALQTNVREHDHLVAAPWTVPTRLVVCTAGLLCMSYNDMSYIILYNI